MTTSSLLPGFRFRPTDDELVGYYLKRKVDGLGTELDLIPVVQLYKYDPWDLPDKSFLPKRDMEWFFFCPRDRKYPNGLRTNRATASGYWKATGKDRKNACEPSVFALRKTLVFYRGRAPGGERMDWVMHEYRLCENLHEGSSNFVGGFALCRVIKRNVHGMKTGDLHGESKAKRCPSSSDAFKFDPKGYSGKVLNSLEENSSRVTKVSHRSTDSTPIASPDADREIDSEMRGFWESQVVSDASKTSLVDRGISSSMITIGNTAEREASPPSNLSPFSVNLIEEEFGVVGGFPGSGSLLAFPSPAYCMGLYGNARDITYQSLELDAPRDPSASHSGTETWNTTAPASVCRQAGEGEDESLWLHEDNLVVVI
ncbi:NAC domain-containing protein 71-like [Musa acuminata AAA Group]|uniref:NAC domain-containing protein 71-like n=1 Tax=Musa acuminata AAA Group TaxID=214697 RepID=UPI0031DC0EE2